MKALETSITINASAQQVWHILTDFSNYGTWNPFIKSIKGEAKLGARLENHMSLPEGSDMTFKPVMTSFEEGRQFSWLGSLWFRGLFDGEHFFRLEPQGSGKVKLIHGERFSGILVRPLLRVVGKKTLAGFIAMNEALKDRAEAQTKSA